MGKEIVSSRLLDGRGVKGVGGIRSSFSTLWGSATRHSMLGAWDAGEYEMTDCDSVDPMCGVTNLG